MSRFTDVIQYLNQNCLALQLSPEQARLFDAAVTKTFNDQGYPDDILSLNWGRFDSNRPSQTERVEIRLALLASICRKKMTTAQAKQYVSNKKGQFKTLTTVQLNTKTGELIRKLAAGLPLCAEAARYTLAHRGSGETYSRATCTKLGVSVEEYVDHYHPSKLGVLVIDMQTADSGTTQSYFGKTVLANEEDVLKLAAKYKLHVYDTVIDAKHAKGDSEQSIFNHPNLQAAWRGAQVHGITKPSHPCFIGTKLESKLNSHGIKELIVMGYNAGQCVKATIFGTPEYKMKVSKGEEENFLKGFKAWDAYMEHGEGVRPYVPGLLDRGYEVVTSRAILASDGPLDAQYELLAGL